MSSARKLVVIVVDALDTGMLQRAVAAEVAPTFAALLRRGTLVEDCVSTFPSVTPVACSEITTGVAPDRHWISGMNWYHRVERRYVEYGTSFEATRAFGLFRTLYDTVYNMNMAHLSPEVETIFERAGDAGVRSAVTPFLIYRGRTRHELGLEGLLRRMAEAAKFHHAVWGPDELFYGELYASRKVPCRPTLARPGTRDEYSACVTKEMVEQDLYDLLLFSLPDNDYHSHRYGPEATEDSIAHADRSLATIVDACGGIDEFCERHAVIMLADHSQSAVSDPLPIIEALAEEWRVLQPNAEQPEDAELAVSPTARAAAVYVLDQGGRHARAHARVRRRVADMDGADLLAWLVADGGAPVVREGAGSPQDEGVEAVVQRNGAELRFRPGSARADLRGARWDLEGDLGVLDAELRDGRFVSDAYPDALARLWSALVAPHAGDLLVSLTPGYECVDWGGATHLGGGSHGSLHRSDSVAPLAAIGLDRELDPDREQWALRDVAGLVTDQLGIGTVPERVDALA